MIDPDLCPHFGVCGGCATQDQPYAQQVAAKEAMVRRVLQPFPVTTFLPMVSSPDECFYRNKMEFAFGGLKDAPPLLGLRQKGKFDRIVDLTECRLQSSEVGRLLASVRAWAVKENLPTYHLKSHRGFLRYLVVREGKNTGQRMVVLVTAEGEIPKESFLEALKSSGARVDTVVWSVNAGLSDVAWGEERAVLIGPGFIEEKLGNLTYKISPRTFFQTNTRGAELLYQVIKEGLSQKAHSLPLVGAAGIRVSGAWDDKAAETDRGRDVVLFDVYCGSGSIGLYCADRADRIIGIELNPQAVADAQANAQAFGISRVEFHTLDAASFAKSPHFLEAWKAPRSVAVMDPPRPGLQPDVLKLLLHHPIHRWVYVSCHLEALARDLSLLSPTYQVEAAQAVDLFPHTPHVETVVVLQKRAGGANESEESQVKT
ncbi:MAG: class I SAM-dependent RNA methyltransferase [Elusimicrobia bacterium]|nr:class I SAM-dependent RNA methyltransferase [Elusimicrobiota bacterium]